MLDKLLNSTTQRNKKTFHQEIDQYLQDHQVQFLRTQWCDNAGIIRMKAMHLNSFKKNYREGLSIAQGQQAVPIAQDTVTPHSGLSPIGEVQLVPDLHSLTLLPFAPGHARAMGDMHLNSEPWNCCPRHFLKRVIAQARKHHLAFLVGFENEFYILDRDDKDGYKTSDDGPFADVNSANLHNTLISDICQALEFQKVTPYAYYPESGPGQHEISILQNGALKAADQQIIFRETVKAVTQQAGQLATFLPKVFQHSASSGCHIHLSLILDKQPIFNKLDNKASLHPTVEHFIAGLLHHLPALMAITSPTTNSYRRYQPHSWVGAYQVYGVQNREAAIRLINTVDSPNIEFKAADATCNPYLALGAMITAGLDGIDNKMKLPQECNFDPSNLSKKQLKQKGIHRLPENLSDSVAALRKNQVLLDALGPELSQALLAIRDYDWQYFKRKNFDEEVRLLIQKF